jgi:hypothetical protein
LLHGMKLRFMVRRGHKYLSGWDSILKIAQSWDW